jgi:hypothetical protein
MHFFTGIGSGGGGHGGGTLLVVVIQSVECAVLCKGPALFIGDNGEPARGLACNLSIEGKALGQTTTKLWTSGDPAGGRNLLLTLLFSVSCPHFNALSRAVTIFLVLSRRTPPPPKLKNKPSHYLRKLPSK